MTRTLRITAIGLLVFNGLSAIWGGWGLIADPTGETMQIPLSFLEHSPFSDFLIPGMILFLANGLLSLVIAVLTIRKVAYYPHLVFLQGMILIIWLSVQVGMIREFYWPLHLPYYLVGVLLVMSGLKLIRSSSAG